MTARSVSEVKHVLILLSIFLILLPVSSSLSSSFFFVFAVTKTAVSSFGSSNAAKIKFRMNIELARSAGANLLTFLYKNPPTVGPAINAKVEHDDNLVL